MSNEDLKIIEQLYKKGRIKALYIILSILFIASLLFIGFGIYVSIAYKDTALIVGIIMIVTGILNVPLAFTFKKIQKKNIKNINQNECYIRYLKIYGKIRVDEKIKKFKEKNNGSI